MNLLLWLQIAFGSTPCLDTEKIDKQVIAELYPVLGHKKHLYIEGRVFRDERKKKKDAIRPKDDMSIDEVKSGSVRFQTHTGIELGNSDIDKEGFIKSFLRFPKEIQAGSFMVEAVWRTCVIGRTTLRILPDDYEDMVLRSDVDMTYLISNFHSIAGLWRLLRLPAKAREAIEGMP